MFSLLIKSIIFGVIQGLTEFLPISSSAHTLIAYDLFDISNLNIITLQVALHFGTLISIIIYFRKKLIIYIKALFSSIFRLKNLSSKSIKSKEKKSITFEEKIIWYIVLATIPIAVFGYFFEDFIENNIHSASIIPITLTIVAILFIISESYAKQSKDFTKITGKNAVIIGISQILALIPGVSRSGITIITGMGLQLKRNAAAEFTFLLAIPTIFGITLKKIIDFLNLETIPNNLWVYIVSACTAGIVGFFCIKYFLKFLANNSLKCFAYYRIVLAIIIIFYLYLN